jgi:predicted transcriptional regulator of viral defense system
MNYLAFEKSLNKFPVFSIKDIKKLFPDFDSRRLNEWQKKEYIQKIKRGYYCFKDHSKQESFLFFTANKIYSPSYISLESALSYYGFIPESAFLITSITSLNTASYNTPVGNYSYKNILPQLFFGYRLIEENGIRIRIAEPEKLLLDYLYLNKLNNEEDIRALRLNKEQINNILDYDSLFRYQQIFKSKILDKRVKILKTIIDA